MKRLTSLALLTMALATGCGSAYEADPVISCRSDSDCDSDEVCFIDGCGDPGKNIVVEVVPNPRGGLHAQDFRVEDLRSQQNIELFDPAILHGEVRVEGTSSSGAYSAPITLRMTGESLLIPGVVRRHESTLVPDNGGYSLPVGVGRYNVTLLATDAELPPLSSTQEVQPGRSVTLNFTLPVSSELVRLSGKVLRQDARPVDVELEVQALDEELRPLSQRVMVKRETGEFTLALPPAAALRSTVVLQVVPTSADALVPQKLFTVSPRLGLQESLSMGDYGEPVRFRSRVVNRDGLPVAQASVSLQGKVSGGGQFRSQKVLTDENGSFELLTLPNEAGNAMTLSIVPPPNSTAGLTLKYVQVPRTSLFVAPDMKCGERMKVRGTLQKPSGSQPAAGVKVVAEPIDELTDWPRSSVSFEASRTTDAQGRFELAMDPGRYRFDFIPTEDLPRVSRIVTVRPEEGSSDGALELSSFTLSKGRSVTGRVSFNGTTSTLSAAPYASIRFFRVGDVEGKPSALLLSQTLTDQSGAYSTTVPAR
ncbi:carboxypeptidase regulatory-like domain-containing protein [Archangium lansingense]|uniref:carboxypeptidase regulatory-like domain-containing protein n=1 Tax=Archangium lansingense TaxID=2995310 RepID=UPI003B76A17C